MNSPESQDDSAGPDSAPAPSEQDGPALDRRAAIARLVKAAAYAAPATLALLSMEAKACSLTC